MNKECLTTQKWFSEESVTAGGCVYFCALISSMIMVGMEPAIEVRRPWILLVAALACLFPAKNNTFVILQKLLAVYFLCMLVSQLTLEKVILGGQAIRIIFPKSMIPLFFYAITFILTIPTEKISQLLKQNQLWYQLWGIAILILVIHMGCLWIPLSSIYRFGYEHNIKVLGKIALYLMCFSFTWAILDRSFIRCISFGCIAFYLLLLMIII